MLDLQNNIKSSQVCGPQPCELCFFAYLCIRNQAKKKNRKELFFLCTTVGMERDG